MGISATWVRVLVSAPASRAAWEQAICGARRKARAKGPTTRGVLRREFMTAPAEVYASVSGHQIRSDGCAPTRPPARGGGDGGGSPRRLAGKPWRTCGLDRR